MSGFLFIAATFICLLGSYLIVYVVSTNSIRWAILVLAGSVATVLLLQQGTFEKAMFSLLAIESLAFGLVVFVKGLSEKSRGTGDKS